LTSTAPVPRHWRSFRCAATGSRAAGVAGRCPRVAGNDAKALRWSRCIECELREMVRNGCMQHLHILLASARTGDGRRAVHLHMSILSRQGRLGPTPDRVYPVSTGFERGSNLHRSIISGCHRILHVVYLDGCTLGQAGVSESGFWFERASSQKACTSTGCF
jgi:hypothetical protein